MDGYFRYMYASWSVKVNRRDITVIFAIYSARALAWFARAGLSLVQFRFYKARPHEKFKLL